MGVEGRWRWRWRVVLATPCSCVQQHRHSGNNNHISGTTRAKPYQFKATSNTATGCSSDRRPFPRRIVGVNHSPRGCRRVKIPAHEVATHDPCTSCKGLICCPIPCLLVPQILIPSNPKPLQPEVLFPTLTSKIPAHPLPLTCADRHGGAPVRRRW